MLKIQITEKRMLSSFIYQEVNAGFGFQFLFTLMDNLVRLTEKKNDIIHMNINGANIYQPGRC